MSFLSAVFPVRRCFAGSVCLARRVFAVKLSVNHSVCKVVYDSGKLHIRRSIASLLTKNASRGDSTLKVRPH